jgi:predicted alpha/beta-hydrolase family hydrolase
MKRAPSSKILPRSRFATGTSPDPLNTPERTTLDPMSQEILIPGEDGHLSASLDVADDAYAFLILAHGSGAGKDHDFMTGFASAMVQHRVSVLRFNFPYMDAGKKFPDKASIAVAAWKQVHQWAADNLAAGLPIFTAGKSFGGRMASLAVSEGMPAEALIFLGYPLHAPKKEDKLRDEHLYPLTIPMLFLEGTRDPFANPAIINRVVSNLNAESQIVWFEGGDHSFKVAYSGRSVTQDGATLAEPTATFIRSRLS